MHMHAHPLRALVQIASAGVIAGTGDPKLQHTFRRSFERGIDGVQSINKVAL